VSSQITVAARISTPYGWLYLGQGTQYRLGAGSFENQQTTFRRSEVQSPYVEGTFVINALRENVTESLDVIVEDRLNLGTADAVRALGTALSQVRYAVQVQIRRDVWTWQAYAADHTVQTKREFVHARLAQVQAEVPRDPNVTYERLDLSYGELASADLSNAELAQYLLTYKQLQSGPDILPITTQVAWPVPEVQ
jgi:hypothetical protein